MSRYYVVIPKNAKNKNEKFLPQHFFDQHIVSASIFGQERQKNNFLMLYKNKPAFKLKDFNKHFLIKISLGQVSDDRELRRMSSEGLHGGNIRINLAEEDKYIKLGLEDPLSLTVEAQIMPNGQEIRESDIGAVKHKIGIKKKSVADKQTVIHKGVVKNTGKVKKLKVTNKAAVKTKGTVNKQKISYKTADKNKAAMKKHKVLNKAAIKAKGTVNKQKISHKTADKNKGAMKKHKVLNKAVVKNKGTVKKKKVLDKSVVKYKGRMKQKKVFRKTSK